MTQTLDYFETQRLVDVDAQTLVEADSASPCLEPAAPVSVDRRGRDQLILDHQNLARSIARRLSHRIAEREDIEQIAMVGLVKAADRFNPYLGIKFSTYAWQTIDGEIKRYFRDHTWSVHVNRSLHERSVRVTASIDELTRQLQRSPTYAEIADDVECSIEEVVEVIELQRNGRPISVDAGDHFDEDSTLELGSADPQIDSADDRNLLATLARRLPPRQRDVVRLRFVEELSQAEIAQRLGCSQMHISRLLTKSLATMREAAMQVGATDA
jgi:RNA polymerase sigma-B factor